MNRKELKSRAKKVVKGHYWILLLACLAASVIGTSFSGSLDFLGISKDNQNQQTVAEAAQGSSEEQTVVTGFGYDAVLNAIVNNNLENFKKRSDQALTEDQAARQESYGAIKIGRSRGVLALLVNMVDSGNFYLMMIVTLQSILKSEFVAQVIFILLSFLLIFFVWVLIVNTFSVVYNRMFLEARTYEKVTYRRFLYLFRYKKLWKTALVMFVREFYLTLWRLTVIGGIIKYFSYRMVEYIEAENPDLTPKQAITLSRKMMHGHKWECFILELSFTLWDFLGILTLGLAKLFWVNSYYTATMAEYYAYLRENYIDQQGEGYELLNDKYLYEHAPAALLEETYADLLALKEEPRFEYQQKNPVLRFLQNIFGVTLINDENEMKRREQEVNDMYIVIADSVTNARSYPGRLSPLGRSKSRKSAENLGYLRCYSILSVIVIFFVFCFIGWAWEVSLHLIQDGVFVNRGVLHGPWLPIYGAGGTMILLLLYRFRKKPWLEFLMAVILAGVVEYMTAVHLEMTHGGQQWWNYDNYYLNINGRVCAEGLIVFGLGGIAVVYLLAPVIDNVVNKIPRKILLPVCIILLTVYAGDAVYSSRHPNAGKGITDYGKNIETACHERENLYLHLSFSQGNRFRSVDWQRS